jgi:hypothetical protein
LEDEHDEKDSTLLYDKSGLETIIICRSSPAIGPRRAKTFGNIS